MNFKDYEMMFCLLVGLFLNMTVSKLGGSLSFILFACLSLKACTERTN